MLRKLQRMAPGYRPKEVKDLLDKARERLKRR
jgi:hypothetical protein